MRLFIAAELPDSMLDALADTSAALRDCVRGRYVAPDSFHVTLAFLGDVSGYRVADVQEAIDCACAGKAAFEARLGDLGSFGKRAKATLWQAVGEPQADDAGKPKTTRDGFAALAADVRRELRARDFDFDDKKFLAHITLMRAADLQHGTLPSPAIASGTIGHVTLFQSDLSGSRPRYEALHTVALEGATASSDW